jgi:hypothetical protein
MSFVPDTFLQVKDWTTEASIPGNVVGFGAEQETPHP